MALLYGWYCWSCAPIFAFAYYIFVMDISLLLCLHKLFWTTSATKAATAKVIAFYDDLTTRFKGRGHQIL